MCGIAGIMVASGLDARVEEHIDKMLYTIRHRGPDGKGIYINRATGIALGNVRLALVDLSLKGHQPMVSRDKKLIISANSEFYGFRQERTRLTALGDKFYSKSDVEIALHLYRREGAKMLDKLRGEFAFSIFDNENQELFVARDRFGVRPIYYYHTPDLFVFASEAKAILAIPGVPRKLCKHNVISQLLHITPPGSSSFEGVHMIKPGHYLKVKRRNGKVELKQECYWDIAFPSNYSKSKNIEEQMHNLRDKLIESVDLRMEADVPVGYYLSGGLDSSAIAGIGSHLSQKNGNSFVIKFIDDRYDESDLAANTAKSLNVELDIIPLSTEDLYGDNFVSTIWHGERVFYNTLAVAKYCLSREVSKAGYKTVLTGEGADELFAGYPAFKSEVIGNQKHIKKSTFDEILKGAVISESVETHPYIENNWGFTPAFIQPWIAISRQILPMLSNEYKQELEQFDPWIDLVKTIDTKIIQNNGKLDKAQYLWCKTLLETQILGFSGDRADMAHSIEARPPFLDHHLAELAFQVPPIYRINGNVEKWILREIVKGIVPKNIYSREKFPFMAPPSMAGNGKAVIINEMISTYLSPRNILEAGIFDLEMTTNFLVQFEKERNQAALIKNDIILNHLLGVHILWDLFEHKFNSDR